MKNNTLYNITIVSAPQMDGNIAYYYDMDGIMRVLKNNMQTENKEIIKFFQTHTPIQEHLLSDLIRFAKKRININLHLTTVPADLSFDNFWHVYNYKKGKLEAKTEWDKLTEVDKALVFRAIPKYNNYLQLHKNQDKIWASRYLKRKRYLDET